MFQFGNILKIPLFYIFRTIFFNEKGLLQGIRQVVAFFVVSFFRLKHKARLDFYDFAESPKKDLEKLAIKIPAKEYELEYRRPIETKETESVLIFGGNSAGARLLLRICRTHHGLASIWISLKLDSGEEYYLPTEQFYVEPKTGQESFVGGGLRMKCLIPMRRWRVTFNGFLKKKQPGRDKTVHVRFGFLWIASSDPHDVSDAIHVKTWADFLSTEDDWIAKLEEVKLQHDRWIQAGNILGVVKIPDDGIDDKELFLWGARRRSQERENEEIAKSKEYICYFETGEFFYCGQIKLLSAAKTLDYGFVTFSNSLGGACNRVKIKDDEKGNKIVEYSRGPIIRHCIIKKAVESQTLNNGDFRSTVAEVSFIDALLEGEDRGHGIIIENEGKTELSLKKPKIKLPPLVIPKRKNLVIPLTDKECRLSEISGGKGSSLAELTILSQENEVRKKFQVPRGIVVTTTAYEQHVKDTRMLDIIEPLENISRHKPNLLQDSCKLAVLGFQKRPLSQEIKNNIEENLQSSFGKDFDALKFAVRSSASGEDSEELSAAGQMTTYLGVQGVENIYNAVAKCWASQFSFIAVQYKRQYGQVLNSPMAVVIQEMIPADVAGVMFTCDPVTGSPSKMTITANYGIGESVVSAAAEPDTMTIGRNENGLDGSSEIDIGKKSMQIVLSGNGGVKEESLSEELSKRSCLSLEDGIRLAEIGILVEKSYGIPVDMEWGIYHSELFLLQARPITTFERESDFEISHEIDTPIPSEGEYTTTANVGEVMPDANSHLGALAVNTLFQVVFGWEFHPRGKHNFPVNPYFLREMMIIQNHILMSILNGTLRFYHGESDLITESQMISLFGRLLDDEDMLKQATKRNVFYPSNSALTQTYYILSDMLIANKRLKKAKDDYWDFECKFDSCQNSAEMLTEIWKQMLETSPAINVHLACSMSSSLYNTFLLSILEKANKGWGQKVFKDFAYVLSSCYEVESVDVPNALEKLSSIISTCTNPLSFKNLTTEDACKWLNTTGSEAGVAFKQFLKLHGHRCYKEFDVYSKPWGTDPLPLVKTLQNMANAESNSSVKKGPISIGETIKNLTVSLDWKQKLLARIAIPLCRKAVGMRERSKSLLIKMMDKMRKGFCEIANAMVKEGRLPDSDLFYFLTYPELLQLIQTRSPSLIQKAIRRRALFPAIDKIKFPEINKGYPVPINYSQGITQEGSLKMQGTPVSVGVVEGFARVATSVEDASSLQKGEILIAYSTDIGWSPFFPMLGGVATELGGLVSHGAVVAREYGLPCVVGVHGATIQFKTGDRVVLNGNKGTLERIDN